MKKLLALLALTSLLISTATQSFAWQHPVHNLAATISYNTLTEGCRQHFNFNDLVYGSTESDLYRYLLINPSHKKDHWRIKSSFEAALKVADTDRALASRRIARSFHYILDQAEPDVSVRKRLYKITGLNFREIGYKVLNRDHNERNFMLELNRKKVRYSRYGWNEILYEVGIIKRNAEKGIEDALRTSRNHQIAYRVLRKSLSEYFIATIALQSRLMHDYCAKRNDHSNQTKESWCRQYADQANSQQNLNLNQKCRFSGPRWQKNFQAHYNWCMTVSIERSKSEDLTRQKDLYQCRQKNNLCRKYASDAVAQNGVNLSRGCGYTGPRWQSNWNNHYNWCQTVNSEFAISEDNARKKGLRDCGRNRR